MNVYWRGKSLPQIGTHAWSTGEGEPFACGVLSADGEEYSATITFLGARWTQKSTSPQGAVDGAARKAGQWLSEFTSTARWLAEFSKAKMPAAHRGTYTMAKVPDSPEQEEWIRRKRNGDG